MSTGEKRTASPSGTSAGDPRQMLQEILTLLYRQEGMTAQGFQSLWDQVNWANQRLAYLTGEVPSGEQAEAAVAESSTAPPSDSPEEFTAAPEAATAFPEAKADDETIVESAAEIRASMALAQQAPAAELPPAALPQPATPIPQSVQQVPQAVRVAPTVAMQHGGGEIADLVFRQDLAYHASLAGERQELINDLRAGNAAATSLVGQIFSVRSATIERLPTLLKDVGEAWYRWRPDNGGRPDALRDALIAWLHAKCDEAGLGNRVELVRVGDRYDSKRHNAKRPGVEVTDVQGWLVLRDNGSVYTKANVLVT